MRRVGFLIILQQTKIKTCDLSGPLITLRNDTPTDLYERRKQSFSEQTLF